MGSIDFLEILGYAASIIIAISITLNSIIKLRILNGIGALLFSIYGFIIKAYPVGILNGFIFLVNLFYLVKLFYSKELFEFMIVEKNNQYLVKFIEFYHNDIKKFFPDFEYKNNYDLCILTLRNLVVAGVFLGHYEGNVLVVDLDYVTKEYRDFKNGKKLYKFIETILKANVNKIVSNTFSKKFNKYLKRTGFAYNNDGKLEKTV